MQDAHRFCFRFLKGVTMLNVTIHHAGGGICSLTGKEGDGLAITFDDGTVKNQFLSWKAFRQLLAMKMTTPKTEWPAIAAEASDTASLYAGYIAPLAAIGPVALLISMTVMIGGMPAARMGDMTSHGGVIVLGAPTVMIG